MRTLEIESKKSKIQLLQYLQAVSPGRLVTYALSKRFDSASASRVPWIVFLVMYYTHNPVPYNDLDLSFRNDSIVLYNEFELWLRV